MMKNRYTPKDAAKFLNITMQQLQEYTTSGDIPRQYHQGEYYYLGGHLDYAKAQLQQKYHLNAIEVIF